MTVFQNSLPKFTAKNLLYVYYTFLTQTMNFRIQFFRIHIFTVILDGQHDVANALKRFLIGQFIKFFLLIGPSNVSKHL